MRAVERPPVGAVRQVIVRGNGHEKPALLISNDFESPVISWGLQSSRRS